MSTLHGLDWIAADWGTSNLRLWAMSSAGAVLARAESEDGMGKLDRTGFEPALLRLAGPWLPEGRATIVVACGMVGSRQGWVEAPYRAVPCAPFAGSALARPPVSDRRVSVHVVPGLKQERPADVIRGEETQIAGFLSRNPGYDGVLCLPGTHAKWVHVSAGEVVSFQTCMTGEIFALLSQQSVLRHGIAAEGWDEGAFLAALSDGIANPARFATRLFGLRAEGLLHGLDPVLARSRLSGLLIGLELAATRAYWLGQSVTVIGAGKVAAAYVAALGAQGVAAQAVPVEEMTLAGLCAARATLAEGVA